MAIYHEDHSALGLRCKAILNHKTGFTLIEAIRDWLAAEFENLREKGFVCSEMSPLRPSACVLSLPRLPNRTAAISRSINSL